jgi:Flp pilus assembly protein TadD
MVGESYRNWAEELRQLGQSSRTAAEREKNTQLAADRLSTALEHFVAVRSAITVGTNDTHRDPMRSAMVRNCYMLAGTVLFDLGRYEEAVDAFYNVSSLYPDDPFVLETFVQIANCWRRLGRTDNARGAIRQAQIAFERLPADADFSTSTALSREEWRALLANMERW